MLIKIGQGDDMYLDVSISYEIYFSMNRGIFSKNSSTENCMYNLKKKDNYATIKIMSIYFDL